MPKAIDREGPPSGTTPSEPLLYRWQPVLPGALRFLLLGARAGAMMALRHQLLRQSLGKNGESMGVMVSGSIPVQHRVPRPVPLPANRPDDRAHALQTWASYFEPATNALVTSAPADEAFFAPAGLAFTLTETTLQAVKAAKPTLDLTKVAAPDVLNRPIAGLDALRGTLHDKLGDPVASEVLPLFARLAERSYGAGVVKFRCTAQTRGAFKEAGFDPEAEPYKRFAWNAVDGLPFDRFSQLATEFKLLETLQQLQTEKLMDSVQAGAFVSVVYELTRQRFGAGRVELTLSEPAFGEIGREWTGNLAFRAKPGHELDDPTPFDRWQIDLSAELDDRRLVWKLTPDPASGAVAAELVGVEIDRSDGAVNSPAESPAQTLNRWVAGRSTGDTLLLEARITPKGSTDGFAQVLRFLLRFVEKDVLPLPLGPAFIHFEDPEYNRLLATPAAHASAIVAEGVGSTQEVHTVTLAADRKRYNADSMLYLRYDWDDERKNVDAELSLERVSGEVVEPLRWNGDDSQSVQPANLTQISLSALRLAKKVEGAAANDPFPSVGWRQGDVLQMTLKVLPEVKIQLRVAIVQEPVEPSPEAGYALLRQQTVDAKEEVECTRFAFGPRPARIDLVSADDLRLEIVRRRAVFQWIDAARPGASAAYVVQKIAMNGSTHIPSEFKRVSPMAKA